jgi:hypothetical protein
MMTDVMMTEPLQDLAGEYSGDMSQSRMPTAAMLDAV